MSNGWMSVDCKCDDLDMIDWMGGADIGDVYSHRLGVIVRLKNV